MEKCVRCGRDIDLPRAFSIRLNNTGMPNSEDDMWGYAHKDCLNPDDWAELGGTKYFGKEV